MEMKRFTKMVVVVTGGATGIGQACAKRFSQEGANIAILDINDTASENTASDCKAFGVETLAIHCDVTNEDSIKASINTVIEKWGRIDVLVASAGIYTGSPLPDVSINQWQRTIDINLTGVFLANKIVLPILAAQNFGSIINVSSMAGKTSWPWSAEYSSSKSGVIGLTRSVAQELAPHGVTVNAICPGNTMTDLLLGVAAEVGSHDGLTPDEWLELRVKDCPMKRVAEPWEIAGVVAFLASEDSRYLTGQAIEVDGGMVMS